MYLSSAWDFSAFVSPTIRVVLSTAGIPTPCKELWRLLLSFLVGWLVFKGHISFFSNSSSRPTFSTLVTKPPLETFGSLRCCCSLLWKRCVSRVFARLCPRSRPSAELILASGSVGGSSDRPICGLLLDAVNLIFGNSELFMFDVLTASGLLSWSVSCILQRLSFLVLLITQLGRDACSVSSVPCACSVRPTSLKDKAKQTNKLSQFNL